MPVSVRCKTCAKDYKVSSRLAGKSVRCPGCQGPIKVPLVSSAPASPSAPARPSPPDDGEYDLAALAAAENAAQATEERVYIAPTIVREPAEPRFSGLSRFSGLPGSNLLRSVWLWFHAIMLLAFLVGISAGDDARLGALLVIGTPLLVLQIMFLYTLLTSVYKDKVGLFVLALIIPLFNFLFILYTLATSPATLVRPAKVFANLAVVVAYLIGLVIVETKRFPNGRANAEGPIPARYSSPAPARYSQPEPAYSPPPPAPTVTRRTTPTRTNRITTPSPGPAPAPDPGNSPFRVPIR